MEPKSSVSTTSCFSLPQVNEPISSSIEEDLDKTEFTSTDNGTTTDSELETAKMAKILQQQQAELLWKTFTDEEYSDWKTFKDSNYKVPLLSVFSYVKCKPVIIEMPNVPPKTSGPRLMTKILKSNYGAIALVLIGEKKFRCIPCVLKCFSVWFSIRDWRITRFKFKESEVPPRGFEVVYEWMCSNQLPKFEDLLPALQVACHLKVTLLEKEIWKILSDDSVREKVAFLVYLDARRVPGLGALCEAMLTRFRKYFLALVGSPDFVHLSVDVLEDLLRQDSIGVNSEMEVFFAVTRWLGHSRNPKRQEHLQRLMKCVRFHHMPITFLFSLRESFNHPDKSNLFRNDPVMLAFSMDSEMMDTLEHAIYFIGVRSQCGGINDFLDICESHHMEVVLPRLWVYHVNCPYHLRTIDFPYQHRFTATDFSAYINSIQKEWSGKGPPDNGKDLVIDVELDPLLDGHEDEKAKE
ncbi:uncharacterized protein LOC6610530 [Drosophila sechellia]|uniref:GM14096 n=1 Tax=Drosophila sechellia TaxID=7238 RepID=B4HTH5_DROSE|nr:uncharacterized protein LOC6610530 [Drosophila sechellia]EDW50246.1 GM14096 [Drosophila sechellia]